MNETAMQTRHRRADALLTVALVGLNLVAFNLMLGLVRPVRVDLTEERLYSVSPATRALLESLDDTVTVIGYFSERTHPKLAPLVPQIEDTLAELAAVSGGRLAYEIVDPGADEEAEQEATGRYGVRSTPFRLASKFETGIVNAYFALVVKFGDQYVRYGFEDLIAVEPLPDGDVDVRLRNLEYDIARAVRKVTASFRGTEELFERLDRPVRLVTVISRDSLPEVFAKVPEAVREAAEELQQKAGDKFAWEDLDPSDPEVEARVRQRWGTRPYTLGLFDDRPFYLHGYLEYGDQVEQLVLAGEGITAADVREAILASLRRRVPGYLTTVGLVTPEPDFPPQVMQQLAMQGRLPPPEFEELRTRLEADYAVKRVDLASDEGVPADVDILVVLRPQNLAERAVYNLDQYLMRGGRVILCAGRFKANLFGEALSVTPVETGLDDWLGHFGVKIEKTLVLDDRNQALPIPVRRMTPFGVIRTWELAPYPYLIDVRDDGIVQREIAARVEEVGIYWGSPVVVEPPEDAGFQVIELLRSSERSWTDDEPSRAESVSYAVPEEGTEPHLLAVALAGTFESAWAGKEPPARSEETTDEAAEVPLERSPETRLVVIGNAEFLSDFVGRMLGPVDGSFFEQNLAWMQNLIDWMTLDNSLLGIRARGGAVRRLARLEPQEEFRIELVNYVAALLTLLAAGAVFAWRRRLESLRWQEVAVRRESDR